MEVVASLDMGGETTVELGSILLLNDMEAR